MGIGVIVSPTIAGTDLVTLAQVVDTNTVQDQRVSDVVETMQEWKLLTLGVSMIL